MPRRHGHGVLRGVRGNGLQGLMTGAVRKTAAGHGSETQPRGTDRGGNRPPRARGGGGKVLLNTAMCEAAQGSAARAPEAGGPRSEPSSAAPACAGHRTQISLLGCFFSCKMQMTTAPESLGHCEAWSRPSHSAQSRIVIVIVHVWRHLTFTLVPLGVQCNPTQSFTGLRAKTSGFEVI